MLISNMLRDMYLKQKAQQTSPLFGAGYPAPKTDMPRKPDARVGAIDSKLMRGEALTGEELSYLCKNSPTLYGKAMRIMRERKAFENRLKSCKTREEAEAARANKIMNISGSVQPSAAGGQNDSSFTLMRLSAANDVYQEFTRSARYKNLPEGDERRTTKDRVELHTKRKKERRL